jgi:hypothetical protein
LRANYNILLPQVYDDAFGKQSTMRSVGVVASLGMLSSATGFISWTNPYLQSRTITVRIPSSTLLFLVMSTHVSNAAVVQRCEGPQGHVTFTHSNCPESQPWIYQRATNPSSGKKPMAPKPAARALPVTIVEDGTRTPPAATSVAVKPAAKKKRRVKKQRTSKYLGQAQTPPPKKLKMQKAKSPQ